MRCKGLVLVLAALSASGCASLPATRQHTPATAASVKAETQEVTKRDSSAVSKPSVDPVAVAPSAKTPEVRKDGTSQECTDRAAVLGPQISVPGFGPDWTKVPEERLKDSPINLVALWLEDSHHAQFGIMLYRVQPGDSDAGAAEELARQLYESYSSDKKSAIVSKIVSDGGRKYFRYSGRGWRKDFRGLVYIRKIDFPGQPNGAYAVARAIWQYGNKKKDAAFVNDLLRAADSIQAIEKSQDSKAP